MAATRVSLSMDDSVLERAPLTRQLKGLLKPSARLPADWDYRELLGERMMERFAAR